MIFPKPSSLALQGLLALVPIASQSCLAQPSVNLAPAFPGLVFDDNASAAALVPDGSRRIVVALQRGQLRVLPDDRDATEAPMFLDLREKMKEETDFEEGMHGLAFHPKFSENRRVYLCYSQRGPRRTVISEFMVPEGASFQADPRSERVILEFPHPLGNHWGGGITFGPDGYLYVGIGDGGLRDDPYRLSQNMWSLHGKILRLDVDKRSAGLAYAIPADNPFSDKQEIRGEIWASGLRNPWGMNFDNPTGTLWCGDVGQDKWEEVNLIKRGANYGWSERDGPEKFEPRLNSPDEAGPFTAAIHSYPHTEGISITGGYVYRGERLPRLQGRYLFGDWGMGKIWALSWDAGKDTATAVNLIHARTGDQAAFNPTVFFHDADGEPLIFSHYPSVIFTLTEPQVLAGADVPELSDESAPADPADAVEGPGDELIEDETSSS